MCHHHPSPLTPHHHGCSVHISAAAPTSAVLPPPAVCSTFAHFPDAFASYFSSFAICFLHVPRPTSHFPLQSVALSFDEDVVVLPWMWRATPSMLRPAPQASLNITLASSHFTLNHFTLQSVALSFLPRMPWFCRGCRGSAVVVVVLPWMPPIHAAAGSLGQSEFPLHACHFILHTLHSAVRPANWHREGPVTSARVGSYGRYGIQRK